MNEKGTMNDLILDGALRKSSVIYRGGSRTVATSKMERFVIITLTKRSILDVATVLDPPLHIYLTES